MGGKQPRISLGTYPAISLQQARERAAEGRALVANGIDPRKKRRDEKHRDALVQINTLKAAAEYWYKHKAEAGALPQHSPRSAPIWTRTFFLSWVRSRYNTSRMRTAPGCRNASKNAMRTTSRKNPGAGSNKSSARPLHAGFDGYERSGIDGLAEAAGVTNGAFYGHVKSKGETFQTVVQLGLEQLRLGIADLKTKHGKRWIKRFVEFYLGPKRTCDLAQACALPSLSPEIVRANHDIRTTY